MLHGWQKSSLEIFRFTQRKPTLAICSAASTRVESVQIITDRDTGRWKGFASVQMTDDDAAEKAIAALNGKEIGGCNLTVNEARLMEKRDHKARGGGGGRKYAAVQPVGFSPRRAKNSTMRSDSLRSDIRLSASAALELYARVGFS